MLVEGCVKVRGNNYELIKFYARTAGRSASGQ